LSFCSNCGSRIGINEGIAGGGGGGEETYLLVGSLDESVLCGERDGDGKRVGGEIGKVLGKPLYHGWMENAIPGLTDKLEGKHFAQDTGMPGP
jgi:hypothetical protein